MNYFLLGFTEVWEIVENRSENNPSKPKQTCVEVYIICMSVGKVFNNYYIIAT